MNKLLLAGMALIGLVGAGISGGSFVARKEQPMEIQTEILQELHSRFSALPGANLKRIDCKPIFSYDTSKSTLCFISRVKTENLLPMFQHSLAQIAQTNGWTQDYGVWGAFYALNVRPKWTFGVNVESIESSADFEGLDSLKGFESFVSVTVSSQPKP